MVCGNDLEDRMKSCSLFSGLINEIWDERRRDEKNVSEESLPRNWKNKSEEWEEYFHTCNKSVNAAIKIRASNPGY